jgi:hypothetical protein
MYYLANDTILFSEEAERVPENEGRGEFWRFDAKRTIVIQPVREGNRIGLNMSKLSEGTMKPSNVIVPMSAITMICDCGDEAMLAKLRAALAGIIMPGKN